MRIVNIRYKCRDEWHIFTSDDLPGLYVASKDVKKAFEDVPVAVNKLIELDYGSAREDRRDLKH